MIQEREEICLERSTSWSGSRSYRSYRSHRSSVQGVEYLWVITVEAHAVHRRLTKHYIKKHYIQQYDEPGANTKPADVHACDVCLMPLMRCWEFQLLYPNNQLRTKKKKHSPFRFATMLRGKTKIRDVRTNSRRVQNTPPSMPVVRHPAHLAKGLLGVIRAAWCRGDGCGTVSFSGATAYIPVPHIRNGTAGPCSI